MRGRSLHNSTRESVKGDSLNSLTVKTIDNDRIEKSAKSDKPEWVSDGVDVTTVVKRLLELRPKRGNQKIYDLNGILANPHFLERCYSEIRSKPGNMTKGITNETLDRID